MANSKIEEPFTPIENKILEQVYKLKLNGTQFKIIMVVWRFTSGFNRDSHDLSVTFIAKAIQGDARTVKRELNNLIEMKILKVISEATFSSTRIISFNRDFTTWVLNNHLGGNKTPRHELTPESGGEMPPESGGEAPPQERNIKENRKKASAPDLFLNFWNEYPRKVAKATAKKSFDKLKVDESLLKQILQALEIQKQSKQWQDKNYIPHAATWINQKRWEDEMESQEEEQISMIAEGVFKI